MNFKKERTEGDESDQAIQRVLRDVHIANFRDVDLSFNRGDGHVLCSRAVSETRK